MSHLSTSSWYYFTPESPQDFLVPLFQMTAFLQISVLSQALNVIRISTVPPSPHYLPISPSASLFKRLNASGSCVWISGNSNCSFAGCKMQMHPESSCNVLWLSGSSGYQPSSSHVSPSMCSLGQTCTQGNLCT